MQKGAPRRRLSKVAPHPNNPAVPQCTREEQSLARIDCARRNGNSPCSYFSTSIFKRDIMAA